MHKLIVLLGLALALVGLGGIVGFIPLSSTSCAPQYGWFYPNGSLAGTQTGNNIWQGPNLYASPGVPVAINGVTVGTLIGQQCYASASTSANPITTTVTSTLTTTQTITSTVYGGQTTTMTATATYQNIAVPPSSPSISLPFIFLIVGLFLMGFGFMKRRRG